MAVIGCGNRGADVYARHLTRLGARVTHLVDAHRARLGQVAARHAVPPERQFTHWDAFFAQGRVADAVVIATPDDLHVQPCLLALQAGYHVLLEKPVCLTEAELDVLLAAEHASRGSVTVAHVLRTTPFFRALRDVVAGGTLGRLVGVVHAENVAYWHYVHSYVRGNWRLSPPSAPFVLAKSSHDLDILRWLAGSPPAWVMATGDTFAHRREDRPAGAADRCLDCEVRDCRADARRTYLPREPDVWPNSVVAPDGTREGLLRALRNGPYGACAFLGQSNQPDHCSLQVAFVGGVRATLTVSAFTHNNTRTLRLHFTDGEVRAHMELGELEVHHFGTGEVRRERVETGGTHGGGDAGLVTGWLAFLRGEAGVPTPLHESLDSHRMAFAAERARLSGQVQRLA
ncbi:streptomycin biosynthesis protein StrI [Deinococcus aquiradiocola]|uniref:Streptomycin biosynthesis protein StrI n=1 Tax=Deinococcus aquiradiocola TaxID=393059 RepID=A0A917P6U9_9DEIO|nr:streptomycin biosynthesis protein StrI [Deinococcus aquiradiocola]